MIANLKVGKTIKALANLTTPLTPQTPFAPWGVSPQAERLLSPLPLPSLRSLRETDRSALLNRDLLKIFNKIFPFQIFCLPLPSHYIYCTRVPQRR